MTAPLGAGYGENAQDVRNAISNFSRQALQFNLSFGGFAKWLSLKMTVPQGQTVTTLEQWFLDQYNQQRPNDATNAANAHTDFLQAQQWLNEMTRTLQYATTQQGQSGLGTTAVTDNTAGTAPVSVSVPVGSKAYVTADAALLALHDGVGTDTSPVINEAAPPQF